MAFRCFKVFFWFLLENASRYIAISFEGRLDLWFQGITLDMIFNNDSLFGMDFIDSNRCQRLTLVEDKLDYFISEFQPEEMHEKTTCDQDTYQQGFHFCQWNNGSTFTHGIVDIYSIRTNLAFHNDLCNINYVIK